MNIQSINKDTKAFAKVKRVIDTHGPALAGVVEVWAGYDESLKNPTTMNQLKTMNYFLPATNEPCCAAVLGGGGHSRLAAVSLLTNFL